MSALEDERERLLDEAFMVARGERLAQLRGRYLRRFDESGLHPFSFIIGQIARIEWMLDTPNEERVHPVRLRQKANEAAQEIVVEDIKRGDPKWAGQE